MSAYDNTGDLNFCVSLQGPQGFTGPPGEPGEAGAPVSTHTVT